MSNENRGLASADEEIRERVTKKGGEARAQDREGLAEAGRKGGEARAEDEKTETSIIRPNSDHKSGEYNSHQLTHCK